MNQILSIENNKGKNQKSKSSGPLPIDSILKFFSITILIMGICMIGTGSYSMYKDSQVEASKIKPTIYVQEISESEILLKVTHNKALSKITYKWNDEQEIGIQCSGKKNVEQAIEIPTGTNILSIYASDINGQEVRYERQYYLQGDITINMEVEGSSIKVTATGIEELSYMTYRWDDEEETKIEINDISTVQNIEIPKGLHTLTVIVVDVNNSTETQKQEVQGITKPTLEVTTDGEANFIIKGSDEEGLEKIEVIINDTEKYRDDLTGKTECEYKIPFKEQGETRMEVTIYNTNGLTEKAKVKVSK